MERHNTSFAVIDGRLDTCVHFDVFYPWFGGEPSSELNQPWIRIQLGEFLVVHKVSVLLGMHQATGNSIPYPQIYCLYNGDQ